jgi:transposase
VQATNWRAEQAIRPAVVSHKTWGGNRTWAGAEAWQVLTACCPPRASRAMTVKLLAHLLHAPVPTVVDLATRGADQCHTPR